MELITFFEWPVEPLRERSCDRRLPAARDTCDDEDAGTAAMLVWFAFNVACGGAVLVGAAEA